MEFSFLPSPEKEPSFLLASAFEKEKAIGKAIKIHWLKMEVMPPPPPPPRRKEDGKILVHSAFHGSWRKETARRSVKTIFGMKVN